MWVGSPNYQSSPLRSRSSRAALAFYALIVGALLFRSNEVLAQHGGATIEINKAEPQSEELRPIEEKLSSKHSFALVLGIDTFDDGVWPRLPGVLKEIKEVRAAFIRQGFQIDTNLMEDNEANPSLKPLNAEDLNQRIRNFLDGHGRDAANRLVIYVATHGHADAGSDEKPGYGYLVAKDSPDPNSLNFARRAYSVTKLANELLTVQSQHIYFFFNACFSGAMVPLIQLREKAESGVAQLDDSVADWAQRLLAYNARLILTAGSDNQTVPDVNNPFSKAVVEGLAGAADQNGDGLILGSELASYVRARVATETRRRQHPNDPVFAFVPKTYPPTKLRSDLALTRALTIDYRQNGDFVFLSPRGARRSMPEGQELAALQQKLPQTQSIDCQDCPIMVRVSGGEKILPFLLAQTETTFSQWDACFRDFYCQTWVEDHGNGRGNRPVSGITWQDALQFISWLDAKKIEKSSCKNYRLPSPIEWTFAARGNTATRYPWGDRVELDQANCWNCGSTWDGTGPAPVKRFSPNAFELYDMIGNLWEWVESPDNRCNPKDMQANGRCVRDGSVMGGAYSTRLQDISFNKEGIIPRTSNDKQRAYRLASVGLRVACTLQEGQSAANSK